MARYRSGHRARDRTAPKPTGRAGLLGRNLTLQRTPPKGTAGTPLTAACRTPGRRRSGWEGLRRMSGAIPLPCLSTPGPLALPEQWQRRHGWCPAPACLPGSGTLRCRGRAATAQPVPHSRPSAGRRVVGVPGALAATRGGGCPSAGGRPRGLCGTGDEQRQRRGWCPAPACLPGGRALQCRGEAATTKQRRFPCVAGRPPGRPWSGEMAATEWPVPRSWAPAGRRAVGCQGGGRRRAGGAVPRGLRSASGPEAVRAGCASRPGVARPCSRRPAPARAGRPLTSGPLLTCGNTRRHRVRRAEAR